MEFIEFAQAWSKSEILQGKVMVASGVVALFVVFALFKSSSDLLRGMSYPFMLLVAILIGYGGYILYSRPAHVKESIERYEQAPEEAIELEMEKHVKDNSAGKPLLKYVYPSLILLSVLCLMFVPNQMVKGIALGCIVLFASTYIMDNGFVTRSDEFITFLNSIKA